MCQDPNTAEELRELPAALREDVITDEQAERLTTLLRNDPESRQTYVRYMAIAAYLHGRRIDPQLAMPDQQNPCGICLSEDIPSPPIVIQSPDSLHPTVAPFAGFAFSYAVAVVIVGIGLLIGWTYQFSDSRLLNRQLATRHSQRTAPSVHPAEDTVPVGRITGIIECHWRDPHSAPVGFDKVVRGRRFELKSGLMEITYDTGAKVILQGPCVYEAESESGGYLHVGRLTARLEAKSTSEPIRRSSAPRQSFSIRTPTASIVDLGTEFGVEVTRSGISKTYVFRGSVALRVIDNNNPGSETLQLNEHESAKVDVVNGKAVALLCEKGSSPSYVRQLPKRMRIKMFNTGVGLKEGDRDPHWLVVSRSDEPGFNARPAVVCGSSNSMWLSNQADRSQWISVVGGESMMPHGIVCTFRTMFQLTRLRPASAILHGQFAADNHIRAIRLNGRSISVPNHGCEEFGFLHPFSIDGGFVKGDNILEIEVENILPQKPDMTPNPLGLIVELDGSALAEWPDSSVRNGEEP